MPANVELMSAKFYVEPAELVEPEQPAAVEPAAPAAPAADSSVYMHRAATLLPWLFGFLVAMVFGLWVFDNRPDPVAKATVKASQNKTMSAFDVLRFITGGKKGADAFAKQMENIQQQMQDDLRERMEEQARAMRRQGLSNNNTNEALQALQQINQFPQGGRQPSR